MKPSEAQGAPATPTPAVRVSGEGWPAAMHGAQAPSGPAAEGETQQAQQAQQGCDKGAKYVTLDNGLVSLEFECERGGAGVARAWVWIWDGQAGAKWAGCCCVQAALLADQGLRSWAAERSCAM